MFRAAEFSHIQIIVQELLCGRNKSKQWYKLLLNSDNSSLEQAPFSSFYFEAKKQLKQME